MVDRRTGGGSTDTARTSARWRWSCSASAATNGRSLRELPSGCGSPRRGLPPLRHQGGHPASLADEFAGPLTSCWPGGGPAGRPDTRGAAAPLRRAARCRHGRLVGFLTPTGPGCAGCRRDGGTPALDELAAAHLGRYEPVRHVDPPPRCAPALSMAAVHRRQPTAQLHRTPRCPHGRLGAHRPLTNPASRPMPRVWWLTRVMPCSGASGRGGSGQGRGRRWSRKRLSRRVGGVLGAEAAPVLQLRDDRWRRSRRGRPGEVRDQDEAVRWRRLYVAVDLLGDWAGCR